MRTSSLDRAFERELDAFINLAWALAENVSWQDLATRSALSTSCLRNLMLKKTRSPHARTLYKLGEAVGLVVSFGAEAKRGSGARGKRTLRVQAA